MGDFMEVGIEVGTMEDSMVDTMVVIEVGNMVDIPEDTIEVGTMEGSMVQVFTHIGDYMDGDFGDGLSWDGPMPVGLMQPMEDTRI